METYFEIKLWFLVGFVGIGTLALIGIGIAGLIHKAKRRARDRKEREAAWAAHSIVREARERSEQ